MKKILFCLLAVIAGAGALLAQNKVIINTAETLGEIRPLNGVGGGPHGKATHALYTAANIPFARLHDIGGKHEKCVELMHIFPDFDADETLEESYDFGYEFTKLDVDVYIEMSDGITYRMMPDDISGYDITKSGEQSITVYCGEYELQITVKINASTEIESISAVANKDNLTYGDSFTASDVTVTAKYTAKKSGNITARLSAINSDSYQSGMKVALARGAEKNASHLAKVSVKSPVALVSADWTLASESKIGGEPNQTGKVDLKKAVAIDDMGEEYEFDIPIQNLPAGIVHVFVTVTNIDGDSADLQSTLGIIRDYDTGRIDDDSAIYWKETAGCEYDAAGQRYILDNGAPLVGYANLYGPLTAELANPVEGLEAVVEGNIVKINATVDGVYENVEVKVTDAIGAVYTSPAVNLIVDTANPVIELTAPEVMAWSGETLHAEGTVSDGNGIDWLEVSYDAMQTWKKIEITEEGTFSFDENISYIEDGIVPVDFHVVDKSGKETYLTRAVQKDTTPPEVRVIVPESLYLMAFVIMGASFGVRTIFCIILTSVLMPVVDKIPFLHSVPGNFLAVPDPVLIPVIAGLLEGIALGLVFRHNGSTGGSDIIALFLHKYWPISPGKFYLISDSIIITSVLFLPDKAFGDMVYGYIMMVVSALVLDWVTLGAKSSAQVLVFSKQYEKIADHITKEMDRGVTVLKAMGWYTKEDKNVLLILVRKKQLFEITKHVKDVDPKAFMSVTNASGVFGEGFEEIKVGYKKKEK